MRILWIPHAGWHIPQRAHLFCRALAERHEVHVTDCVADFYTWRDYLHPRYPRNFLYRQSREGNITIHGIPRFSPALFFPSLRRLNSRVFSYVVDRIIRRYRIDVVVGTFVVNPPKAPRLVFDLFDDNVSYWLQYGRVKQYAREIENTERAYLEAADVVVAASSVLAEKAGALTSRPIRHIPNAVDLESYTTTDGAAFRSRWNTSGSIVGMLGNYDKSAELFRVLDAARILSAEDLLFVIAGRGPAIPQARKDAQALGLSNVKILENVALQNAADVISAFDIGLCPYPKNPGSDACTPMRLLLYAAAGLPTVCTNLEEVRRMAFSNVVLVEDDPQSLAEGILRARRLPRSRPAQIVKYDLPRLVEQYEQVLWGERLPPAHKRSAMSVSVINDFYNRPPGPETETSRQKLNSILSLFDPDPSANFLDIACHDGEKTVVLRERVGTKRVIGIDFESAALRKAKSRGIPSVAIDLNQKVALPFPDACFDGIHAGEVIEHLFSPDLLLGEIARLLKPNGYAVITTPNLASWRNRIVLLMGWQPFGTEVSTVFVVGNPRASRGMLPGHIRVFTVKALVELVKLYGFSIDRILCVPIGLPKSFFTRLTAAVDFCLQKIFPTMCDSILIRISKKGQYSGGGKAG